MEIQVQAIDVICLTDRRRPVESVTANATRIARARRAEARGSAARQSNRALSTLIALALTFPFIPRGNATGNRWPDESCRWEQDVVNKSPETFR